MTGVVNSPTERLIVVAGATGQQGGAVARHLLRAGFPVRGLSRSESTPAAEALRRSGAELAVADLDQPSSLDAALTGAWGVFSVQNYYGKGVGLTGEVRQGRNLAEAAQRAGVRHFVQSTMAQAQGAEEVEHFRSKFTIEMIVDELQLPRTYLGTVWSMDNLFNPAMGGLMSFPVIAGTLGRDRLFEMMAVDDLGGIAAQVFSNPDRFIGHRIDIAGDRKSIREMGQIYHEVTGRWPPRYGFPNLVTRLLNKDFAKQLRWQAEVGWSFSLEEAKSVYPAMQDFRSFLMTRLPKLSRRPTT
jgi:uncharacterized protein YbjT (DUF2867 family)